MSAITRPILSADQVKALKAHLIQHKVYPYRFSFLKNIDNTDFDKADASGGGRYFTLTFTPQYTTGIIQIAAGYIITPNATTGTFGIFGSYNDTFTFANSSTPDEGKVIYNLISNGGAINDFQVFFPLNWYVEARRPFYIHVWADSTTCTAGTSDIQGQFTVGTLLTNEG